VSPIVFSRLCDGDTNEDVVAEGRSSMDAGHAADTDGVGDYPSLPMDINGLRMLADIALDAKVRGERGQTHSQKHTHTHARARTEARAHTEPPHTLTQKHTCTHAHMHTRRRGTRTLTLTQKHTLMR
jgi:hypothetical protein